LLQLQVHNVAVVEAVASMAAGAVASVVVAAVRAAVFAVRHMQAHTAVVQVFEQLDTVALDTTVAVFTGPALATMAIRILVFI
jgi:vacuolar-type H+-ATPase subunit B/Vma2